MTSRIPLRPVATERPEWVDSGLSRPFMTFPTRQHALLGRPTGFGQQWTSILLEKELPKNQLIVQLPFSETSGWDRLLHIEETLIQAFSQNNFAMVDGHDVGQGKFNIYVVPKDSWGPAIERVIAFLKLRNALNEALVVKQLRSGKYVVVWPENFSGKFEM